MGAPTHQNALALEADTGAQTQHPALALLLEAGKVSLGAGQRLTQASSGHLAQVSGRLCLP